ncbi:MAG: sensor histidine kinase [Candidatus Sericytochromatia bacterium]
MWDQLSPVGHFLIMLIPLVVMPISSAMLARYSHSFGVERYPFPPSRIMSALGLYVSLGVTVAFYQVPGIHASWAFATLALFATSLEGNWRMTGSTRSLVPYRWPLAGAGAAIALWLGLTQPAWPAIATWMVAGVVLQGASVVVLRRSGRKASPATATIIGGYALGLLAVPVAAVILATRATGLIVDVELVLVTISSLLMSLGATTHVLETTALQLQCTRDRIAAEVEARTAELQSANEQLRQMDRMKDQFLSTVSHELRTPLTAIQGYGEFLEDEIEGPLTPGHQTFVRGIMDAVAHMTVKVDDLLDLARITTGSLRFEFGVFGYDEVLLRVDGLMRPILSSRGQTLALEHPADLQLTGDSRRIQQVLVNLVNNASKFSPDGARLAVSVREENDVVVTSVSDPGVGIPEAHRARIFQAFYQVDGSTTRVHEGIGLGLAITRSLVEAHGGRIEVESTPGKGSRFTFSLPKERVGAIA